MNETHILKKLEHYLTSHEIEEIKLYFGAAPSIGVCLTMADVIKETELMPNEEETLCILLEQLMKIYFNKPNTKNENTALAQRGNTTKKRNKD